jgi:hypothetical protein
MTIVRTKQQSVTARARARARGRFHRGPLDRPAEFVAAGAIPPTAEEADSPMSWTSGFLTKFW